MAHITITAPVPLHDTDTCSRPILPAFAAYLQGRYCRALHSGAPGNRVTVLLELVSAGCGLSPARVAVEYEDGEMPELEARADFEERVVDLVDAVNAEVYAYAEPARIAA